MPQGMTHAYVYMDSTNWTQWARKGGRMEGEKTGQEKRGRGEEKRKGGRRNMNMNLEV